MLFERVIYALVVGLPLFVNGQTAGLTQVSPKEWASKGNPTKLDMFLYAPPNLPPNSPIVVAVSLFVKKEAEEEAKNIIRFTTVLDPQACTSAQQISFLQQHSINLL
jgi:hypothetical protein